jgi:predicted transposase/invertase (TIGR01784 family)
VIIYPSRGVESPAPLSHQAWLALSNVQRLYLDELTIAIAEAPIGLCIAQLVLESESRAPEQAKALIARAQRDIDDRSLQREIIELVETIVIYKFPRASRQELEAMLGLGDLKETRFYQEAKQEGEKKGEYKAKIESVPRLLQMNLTLEQIAQALDLPIADVQRVARSQ